MFKDILICFNNHNLIDNTVEAAAKFAVQQKSRLTGLSIKNDSASHYSTYEYIPAELINQVVEEEKKRLAQTKDSFLRITDRYDCTTNWYSMAESEDPLRVMFYTDLICVGHDKQSANNLFDGSVFANHVLLETGRPLMLIPSSWNGDRIGGNILLAWNESRECVRAMHEAMPVIENANRVDVVSVNRTFDNESDQLAKGIEISQYLAHREVNCQLHHCKTTSSSPHVGQLIMEKAKELDSDLIVMGGYSHSRLRELFIGGVTRELCNNSNVPLFLAH
ncbi:MAG: universal stress protein [Gammaproteobacteria bacterium]|nr:universal stress protein [Gammaproteobacteria bacterium]